MENKILIVDDELDICEQLSGVLQDSGFKSVQALSSEHAFKLLDQYNISLIVLDIWLNNSKLDGFQTLEKIIQINDSIPVIMISGHGNIETAVNSIKKGAYDFIEKPFDSDLLIFKVKKALENFKLKKKIQLLTRKDYELKIVANSMIMKELFKTLKNVSRNDSSLFIWGEKGSGKSFISQYIHENSNRKFKNFRIVEFGNQNDDELELNLFGNEFEETTEFQGILDEVNGGTLFLKNLSLISKKFQGKLLRIIEEKKYYKIGSQMPRFIDFRIIASSQISLEKILADKIIRDDLLSKINFFQINMPCINSRKEDLKDLINLFLKEFKSNGKEMIFSNELIDYLKSLKSLDSVYHLKKIVEWILVMLEKESKEKISVDMFKKLINIFFENENSLSSSFDFLNIDIKTAREEFEKKYLLYNLEKHNFNISKISNIIGMERTALYRKLKQLKINKGLLK